jgi:hypothetical protein
MAVTFMPIKKKDVVHALLSLHYICPKICHCQCFTQIVANMLPPYFNKVQIISAPVPKLREMRKRVFMQDNQRQKSCNNRKWGYEYVRAALHHMISSICIETWFSFILCYTFCFFFIKFCIDSELIL